MKLIILTSNRKGLASRVLPILCKNKNIEIVKVIFAHSKTASKSRKIKRIIKKIKKIGLLGSLNGIRMRKWYLDKETEDIFSVCTKLNIKIFEVPCINSDKTEKLFYTSKSDLGVSLGNGYIPKNIFSIPKYGMINVHTEILPDYQGAQSIIWPLHDRKDETGFTIHQIDDKIDTGNIIFQKKYKIKFYPKIEETVKINLEHVRSNVPLSLSLVCENYKSLKKNSIVQLNKTSFTTPTIWEFIKILKNHNFLYKKNLKI